MKGRVWNLLQQARIAKANHEAAKAREPHLFHCDACNDSGVVPSGDPEFPLRQCECGRRAVYDQNNV